VLFGEQQKTLVSIENVRSIATGGFSMAPGACAKNPFCWFELIFPEQRLRAAAGRRIQLHLQRGSVFLIGWNASVIAC